MSYPRFADFAEEEKRLEGEKMRIDEALNLEILITGFKIRDSKYNDKASGNTKYIINNESLQDVMNRSASELGIANPLLKKGYTHGR